MEMRAAKKQAFLDQIGWGNCVARVVAGDASNRRYDRLEDSNGATAILMDAPPEKGEDVVPFVRIATHLTDHGLSAPQIYHQDAQAGFLLIEDLGDGIFARLMASDSARTEALYQSATDVLIALQKLPLPDLPICDADWLCAMSDLAFDWYGQGDPVTAMAAFETAFRPLADALDDTAKCLILRDYHAENLLWLPDRTGVAQVGLLDFQDALLGHPAYDLVSVLQDARRDVDPAIEAAMIARYAHGSGQEPDVLTSAYATLGAQRNLRILGIFARLCIRDGKPHYVDMIPRVWGYLQRNLAHPALAEVATCLRGALPEPTPDFLEHLKSKCATPPTP